MKTIQRRVLRLAFNGVAAGLLAGVAHAVVAWAFLDRPVLSILEEPGWSAFGLGLHLLLSGVLGLTYGGLFTPEALGRTEAAMSGLALGLLWWIIVSLNLVPVLLGDGPRWEAQSAARGLADLLGYLVQGAALGLLYQPVARVSLEHLWPADEVREHGEPPEIEHRVVIVGGGFAGVATAANLERLLAGNARIQITLISSTNHLLFTPMLSEVTAGGVEPRHISASLRTFFRRVEVIRGDVLGVSFFERTVRIATHGDATARTISYEHLVLGVGTVPNFFGLQEVEGRAFTFKSLEDATRLRNHVIDMLERADAEPDGERRRALLTFVVTGGGFAGAELIGGLNDFVRGSLWFYPNVSPDDVVLILVHSGARIMPELSPALAAYAEQKLRSRGVTFKLNTRVKGAGPGTVTLTDGEIVRSETLIWTAGNASHPLIARLGLELDARGAAKTEATLRVLGQPNVWALGDCAAVPDPVTGKTFPPTAQHAVRQAVALAANLCAVFRGDPPRPFRHRSLGAFAVLGHQTACAEVLGVRFSGLLAWWLWRWIYLSKLPSLEKKIRVALDWTIDLFFPRDIVQTGDRARPRRDLESHDREGREARR